MDGRSLRTYSPEERAKLADRARKNKPRLGKVLYPVIAEATQIDHVIPISRGGKHAFSNLLPACASCNFSKHDQTPEEWADAKLRRAQKAE